MIEVGAEAPDFTLPDQREEPFTLSAQRGRRVVLVFYPADFSPVCTDQLSVLQEVKGEFDRLGATVVGITVDSAWSHRAFAEQLGIEFRLLADFHPKGEVTRAYGAYIDERGHANRSLVLVDERGRVAWVHESPTPLEIPGPNLIFDALAR